MPPKKAIVNRIRNGNKKLTIQTFKNIGLNFRFRISWSLLSLLWCLMLLGTLLTHHLLHIHTLICVHTWAHPHIKSPGSPPNIVTILPQFPWTDLLLLSPNHLNDDAPQGLTRQLTLSWENLSPPNGFNGHLMTPNLSAGSACHLSSRSACPLSQLRHNLMSPNKNLKT